MTDRGSLRFRLLPLAVLTVPVVFGAVSACGDDGPDGAATGVAAASAPYVDAPENADPDQIALGARLAASNGCAACHGADGGGGIGPAWIGLADSDVELADGSSLVADVAYIRRAIVQPDLDIVAGYSVKMPENGLTDEEVDALVEYIRSLRTPEETP